MDYDVEILPDRKIRLRWKPGAPRRDRETLRQQVTRMMSLIQCLQGTRPRFEILTKSKEFY
jgi:hypothetical protein